MPKGVLIMKNLFKFLGIISLALVIGFSMAACDKDDDGGDDDGGGSITAASFNGTWIADQQINLAGDTLRYTAVISGENITITSAETGTSTYTATLESAIETDTVGSSRKIKVSGTQEGQAWISNRSPDKLNISLMGDGTYKAPLKIDTANFVINNMTKQ